MKLNEAFYIYLTVNLLLDIGEALSCGYENINDTKIEAEGSFANISYTINVTDTLDVTAIFEVCRNDILKTGCRFVWKGLSKEMTYRNQSERSGMFCFWKLRDHSQSTFTFELHTSYLVERSVSRIIFSTVKNGSRSELPKIIRLAATYPPKVTRLTVYDQEVSGYHLVNEGEEVRVACSFDEGNPPAVFRLMDQSGRELSSGQGRLTYAFSAHCEDDWPRIYCEGNGSKQNRSVSFLIRCPLQFVDNFKVVNLSSGVITFRVKAHSTVFKKCHLTPISEDGHATRTANCTLNGIPPVLDLSLYIGDDKNTRNGTWMVTLHNEEGSTNTTFFINTKKNIAALFSDLKKEDPDSRYCQDSRNMDCRVQRSHPIRVNVKFPENGCRSDLTIYHHPAFGQQRSVFSCDWNERKQAYDCETLESGVIWERADSKHAIITFPDSFEQNSGYFRYQISCYDLPQNDTCSWAPAGNEIPDYTTRVEAIRTAAMRTENVAQEDSNQIRFQEMYDLVAGGIAANITLLIFLLALTITFFLLYNRNERLKLKRKMKRNNSKLKQILIKKENDAGGEQNAVPGRTVSFCDPLLRVRDITAEREPDREDLESGLSSAGSLSGLSFVTNSRRGSRESALS